MTVESDNKNKRIVLTTATENRIIDKLIKNLKSRFEQEIIDKRYPSFRIKDDISRILLNNKIVNINWDSYNTINNKVNEAFSKQINSYKSNPSGVVDLNKIKNMINDGNRSKSLNKNEEYAGYSKNKSSDYNIISNQPVTAENNKSSNNNDLVKRDNSFMRRQLSENIKTYNKSLEKDETKIKYDHYVKEHDYTSFNKDDKAENINNLDVNNPKPIINQIIDDKSNNVIDINKPDAYVDNNINDCKNQFQYKIDYPQNTVAPSINNKLSRNNNSNKDINYSRTYNIIPEKERIKQQAYNNLLQKEMEKQAFLQRQLNYFSQEMRKEVEEAKEIKQKEIETKHNKTNKLKEMLDTQIREKKQIRERTLSQKREYDNKVIIEANKEVKEDKSKLIEKYMTKINQRKQLQQFEEEKKRITQETKIKEKKEEKIREEYNNLITEKELINKKNQLEKQKQHWLEFKENNDKIKKERMDRKKYEKELGKKALADMETLLNKQDESRTKERERLLSKMNNSYSNNKGLDLEIKKQEMLRLEEERRIKAEKENYIKEQEREVRSKIKKENQIKMLREGLEKQIKEKERISIDKKRNDLDFYNNVTLKTSNDYSENKKKIIKDFLTKKELYKHELDKQNEEKARFKLMNNYGINSHLCSN